MDTTDIALQWLRSQSKSGQTLLIVFGTNEARNITRSRVASVCSEEMLRCTQDKITSIFGSTVIFMNRPEQLRGVKISSVILDDVIKPENYVVSCYHRN